MLIGEIIKRKIRSKGRLVIHSGGNNSISKQVLSEWNPQGRRERPQKTWRTLFESEIQGEKDLEGAEVCGAHRVRLRYFVAVLLYVRD